MKKIITISAFLFGAISAKAQHIRVSTMQKDASYWKDGVELCFVNKDTMTINFNKVIRFIRIGENVYQISSPELKLTQPNPEYMFRLPIRVDTAYWTPYK